MVIMFGMFNSAVIQEITAMNEDTKWYSVAELRKRYDVSQITVSRWLRDGFFPGAEKTGPYRKSKWRIPQEAVDHFDKLRDEARSAS